MAVDYQRGQTDILRSLIVSPALRLVKCAVQILFLLVPWYRPWHHSRARDQKRCNTRRKSPWRRNWYTRKRSNRKRTTRKQHPRKSFEARKRRKELFERVSAFLECTKSINQTMKKENNNTRIHCFVRPNRKTIGSHRPTASIEPKPAIEYIKLEFPAWRKDKEQATLQRVQKKKKIRFVRENNGPVLSRARAQKTLRRGEFILIKKREKGQEKMQVFSYFFFSPLVHFLPVSILQNIYIVHTQTLYVSPLECGEREKLIKQVRLGTGPIFFLLFLCPFYILSISLSLSTFPFLFPFPYNPASISKT